LTVFKRLNISTRKCHCIADTGIARSSARSALLRLGPQKLLRVAVPNVNGAGVANAAVLNHMSALRSPAGSSGDTPGTTFARIGFTLSSAPAFAVSPNTLIVKGKPLCHW
jgi:hypothetical protein